MLNLKISNIICKKISVFGKEKKAALAMELRVGGGWGGSLWFWTSQNNSHWKDEMWIKPWGVMSNTWRMKVLDWEKSWRNRRLQGITRKPVCLGWHEGKRRGPSGNAGQNIQDTTGHKWNSWLWAQFHPDLNNASLKDEQTSVWISVLLLQCYFRQVT